MSRPAAAKCRGAAAAPACMWSSNSVSATEACVCVCARGRVAGLSLLSRRTEASSRKKETKKSACTLPIIHQFASLLSKARGEKPAPDGRTPTARDLASAHTWSSGLGPGLRRGGAEGAAAVRLKTLAQPPLHPSLSLSSPVFPPCRPLPSTPVKMWPSSAPAAASGSRCEKEEIEREREGETRPRRRTFLAPS